MEDYEEVNEQEGQEEQELFEHYRFDCDPGQSPLRVDKFLVDRIRNASRSKIQMAASAGNILVNDKSVKPNFKVKALDVVSVVLEYPPREIEILKEDIPLDIIYEDEQLLIVNKQAGLVVHPGHGNYSGTLVNGLAYYLQNLPLFNSKDPRPGLVHRIDKNTTGLLVIAKTELAKNKLAKQFFDKTTKRRYIAIVWGHVKEDEGRIEGNIGRNIKNRIGMDVYPDGDMGKHAVTHYKVLARFSYVSLVECRLETGRTHQIRVHMKHIGHPLFNDEVYGGNNILKGTTFTKYKQFVQNCFNICPRQALHAKSLGFIHPSSGEFMEFDSPLPEDMVQLISKWESYIASRDQ